MSTRSRGLRSAAQKLRDEEQAKQKRLQQEAESFRQGNEAKYQFAQEQRDTELRKEAHMKTLTAEEIGKMTPVEIVKAYEAGLIDHLAKPATAPAPAAKATAEETTEESADDGQPSDQDSTNPVTREQVDKMTPAELLKAYEAGLIDHLAKPATAPAPAAKATAEETAEESADDGQPSDQDSTEPVTPEELDKMTKEEIIAAYKAGRFTPKAKA
ncbi:hypothetical protein [Glutamicibacter sp.]|uniref:hypothetical protein n=1 Tax=Glutamicibacter sp. TaxID=1931995 RepID=UPI002FE1AB26